MADESDLDLAYRLQMEEAIAASLATHEGFLPPRSPSPPLPAVRNLREVPFDFGGAAAVSCFDARGFAREIEGTIELDRPSSRQYFIGHALPQRNSAFEKPDCESSYANSAGISRIEGGNEGESSNLGKPYGEGSSSGRVTIRDDIIYNLYFAGLVNEVRVSGNEVLHGFGIAICDNSNDLVWVKKLSMITRPVARQTIEILSLLHALKEAKDLGIKHIDIFCHYHPVYQFLRQIWTPRINHNAMLMDQVNLVKNQFTDSRAILVTRGDIKHAFKFAREAIESRMTEHTGPTRGKPDLKETCVICLEDTKPEFIFSVDKCFHRYCFSCVKQYVEVKLRHGIIPTCPHEGCESKLDIGTCGKLLPQKLIEMWKQRVKEASIPVTEKVYCPYPRCSALMSKSEVSQYADDVFGGYGRSGARKCVKCHGLFCIECKVPWHNNLSCGDYKIMNPNPVTEDVKLKSLAQVNLWRQCIRCQHMIELSEGCFHMTCRCGYQFCYNCGAEWKNKKATCSCPLWDEGNILHEDDEEEDEDEDEDYDDFGHGPWGWHI